MSTPSYLTPLDPDILKRNLPPDVHATIDQVTANVNQSLHKLIDDFKAAAIKQAEDFKSKALPVELQQELDQMADSYAQQVSGTFSGELASVQQSLASALAASQAAAAASPALANAVQKLAADVQALEQKLNNMRASIRKVGETTSRFAVSTALKAFTGGLA